MRPRSVVGITALLSSFVVACDSSGHLVGLELPPPATMLLVGHSTQLSVVNNTGTVTWSSSAPSIATVSSTGVVTALAPGQVNIAATTSTGNELTGIAVIAGATSLSGKISTTCALTSASALYCWGTNEFGQMGTGDTKSQLTPLLSAGGMTFNVAAAGGEHSCGISSTGTFCWGFNSNGNIGDGSPSFTTHYQPGKVSNGSAFTDIEANGGAGNASSADCSDATCAAGTCAVTAAGDAVCWGDGASIATPSSGTLKFSRISVGWDYDCGLSTQHVGYCWGANLYMQSAGAAFPTVTTPLAIDVGHPLQQISANRAHTCAVTVEGLVYCWGANTSGQLGASATGVCTTLHLFDIPCSNTPVLVATDQIFQSVSVGSTQRDRSDTPPASHTCGITVTLDIYCWGSNVYGQLGNGTLTDSQQPVRVTSSEKFTKVVAERGNTCALTVEGVAWCWGQNNAGQLGDGTTTSSSIPVKVAGGLIFR